MTANDAVVAPAAPADLEEVIALLAEANLPPDGVDRYFADFVVARDATGRLAGCAGVEMHGTVALLRSIAVARGLRGAGLGTCLAEAAIERALDRGATEAVLLTTTAREFFVHRFGFEPADRSDYDARLAGSPEWNLPRCAPAAFLRLGL